MNIINVEIHHINFPYRPAQNHVPAQVFPHIQVENQPSIYRGILALVTFGNLTLGIISFACTYAELITPNHTISIVWTLSMICYSTQLFPLDESIIVAAV